MNLKHKGKVIVITLTKPEQAALAKAKELLERIALVPCAEQEQAKAALESLVGLCPADEPDEE